MSGAPNKPTTASCSCGSVAIEVTGAPILAGTCYCASCQEAGRRFAQRPGAPAVLDPDGGTGAILYRKDRVRFARGAEHLEEHRLTPESPTRRVIATCCNAAMFLDFTKGHWLTIYRDRLPEGTARAQMRVMTRERPEGVVLDDTVPNHAGHSGKFMRKLLTAWLAMGFRTPKLRWGAAG